MRFYDLMVSLLLFFIIFLFFINLSFLTKKLYTDSARILKRKVTKKQTFFFNYLRLLYLSVESKNGFRAECRLRDTIRLGLRVISNAIDPRIAVLYIPS